MNKLLNKLADKLEEALADRWCQVCGHGRPLIPGAVLIRCGNCGVVSHCDNWDCKPPKVKK